jgi:hypothetical protein
MIVPADEKDSCERSLGERIGRVDWNKVASELNSNGFAILRGLFSPEECREITQGFDSEIAFRKTVVMERYRFGSGVYKYWDYPLPDIVQSLRESFYSGLAPIANEWMNQLGIDRYFPGDLPEFQRQCHENGQEKPTTLILRYGQGGYNTLHQDLYGDTYFPIQAACFLSRLGADYTGGEFVLTQQTPRAQSRAIVLTPDIGDVAIFPTNFRPVKGARGYYRSVMKHGVSEVHAGERYTMGIIFHDALS